MLSTETCSPSSQLGLPAFYRCPALLIEFLVDCTIQPVQLITIPICPRVPALLGQRSFGLFERNSRFHPERG